jgi:hypothetical protein
LAVLFCEHTNHLRYQYFQTQMQMFDQKKIVGNEVAMVGTASLLILFEKKNYTWTTLVSCAMVWS